MNKNIRIKWKRVKRNYEPTKPDKTKEKIYAKKGRRSKGRKKTYKDKHIKAEHKQKTNTKAQQRKNKTHARKRKANENEHEDGIKDNADGNTKPRKKSIKI